MSFSILSPARLLWLVAGGLLLVSPANARDTTYVSKNASRCEMFAALSDVLPPDCMVGKKVVVYDEDTSTSSVSTSATAGPGRPPSGQRRAPAQRAMATPIQFAFNSADLTPQAQRQLLKIGQVLSDPIFRGVVIRIEGHTDALGDDAYNQGLSQRRALAVRNALVARFDIPLSLLPARGLGERRLFDAQHPNAAINRRVEFINTGVIR
jgi:outer membrane protein OmpA-like peptidoglycan-associated protein